MGERRNFYDISKQPNQKKKRKKKFRAFIRVVRLGHLFFLDMNVDNCMGYWLESYFKLEQFSTYDIVLSLESYVKILSDFQHI